MAITSSHPLRVYVYNDIVLRFCPAEYVDPVVDPAVSVSPSSSLQCHYTHIQRNIKRKQIKMKTVARSKKRNNNMLQ